MKKSFTTLFFLASLLNLYAQSEISNFQENQEITWGSVSAEKPNYGFYGQEFTFNKKVEISSISVFIVDHRKYDETKATINFSIWSFDKKPIKELFLSEPVAIKSSEIDNWKTYTFVKPLKLKKGEFLFGIGQNTIQGFVAFGNGIEKEGYKTRFWMKSPYGGISDGKNWIDVADEVKAELSEEQFKNWEKAVVMMKIGYK